MLVLVLRGALCPGGGGDALTTYPPPPKLSPKIFISRPGYAPAPTAPRGYAYVSINIAKVTISL